MTYFFWLIPTIIAVAMLLIHFKYPELKKPIEKKVGEWIQFFLPIDWNDKFEMIEKEKLVALMKQSTLSQLLVLRAYRKLTDKTGIYEIATGKKGIGFQISSNTYTSEDVVTQIRRALTNTGIEDVVFQVICYASDNVEDFIERAELSSDMANINIDNKSELEAIRKERIVKTLQWSKVSMHNNSASVFKARNFTNIITLSFPSSVKDSKIRSIANEVRGKLENAGLNPLNLSPKVVVQIYSEILKEGSIKGIDYDQFTEMNIQIARNSRIRLEPDSGTIKLGDGTFAKVFYTEKYPKYTNPIEVANAFFLIDGGAENPLPSKFLSTLTIHIENQEVLQESILSKARFNLTKGKDEEKMKTSTLIADTINESAEVVKNIEDGEKTYLGMWSLAIFEDSIEELETRAGKIKNTFEQIERGGWIIDEEKFGGIAHLSLIHSLPFQFTEEAKEHLNRYNLMFSSNIQSIMPVMGAFQGFQNPIIKFFDRTGQVVGIDLWGSSTNYNCCIIGDSGTGKSFLSNTIQASNLQAGVKTFIVDKGNSYLGFCEAIGGEYITFGEDLETGQEKDVCLNFFTNVNATFVNASELIENDIFFGVVKLDIANLLNDKNEIELIAQEEFEQIIPILKIMSGIKDDNQEAKSLIETAVNIAFMRKGRKAGMKEVGLALKEQRKHYKQADNERLCQILDNLINSLKNYTDESGRYYKYFNGAYNLDSTKDFVVLECDDLISKGQELYNVVIMSAILRNTQEMFADKLGSRKRIVVVDEATPLLKNQVVAQFLDDMARRVRKHNGAIMIITQKTEDFMHNASGRAIWGNSSHKFCLQMSDQEIQSAYGDSGLMKGSSEFIKRLAKSVKNHKPHYSEVLYFYGDNAFPLILKVGGLEYAMFTSDGGDKSKMDSIRKKYSISLADARKVFGYKIDGLTEQEAVKKVKDGDQNNSTIYWVGNIRNAIRNNSISGNIEIISDKEKNPFMIRSEAVITIDGKDGAKEEYKLRQIEDVSNENGFTPTIFEMFLSFVKSKNILRIAIKIPSKIISIGHLKTIKNLLLDNNREVYLAISFEDLKKSRKHIKEFSSQAKKDGFKILLEELDVEKADLELINLLKPDLIALEKNEKKEKPFIEFYGKEAKFLNRKIENALDFEYAIKNGYEYFAGNHIERKLGE